MDSVKTGELIKEIRIEKGMKQKDLAEKVFVSAAAVSKWENGHGFPDVSVLPDLCEVLDLSIEELMNVHGIGEKKYAKLKDRITL